MKGYFWSFSCNPPRDGCILGGKQRDFDREVHSVYVTTPPPQPDLPLYMAGWRMKQESQVPCLSALCRAHFQPGHCTPDPWDWLFLCVSGTQDQKISPYPLNELTELHGSLYSDFSGLWTRPNVLSPLRSGDERGYRKMKHCTLLFISLSHHASVQVFNERHRPWSSQSIWLC